ncbi:MAG: hypothetical protein ACI9OH_000074 [Oleispira sp.]|jgi:hypothetical protein
MLMRTLTTLLILLLSSQIHAYDFKLALLKGNSLVFDYEISVLRLALKNAPGEHTLTIIPVNDSNQPRILHSLKNNQDEFNIFFTGFSQQRENELLQVDFPISRGLLGYRIFAIQKDTQALLAGINTIEQLKSQVIIGSGIGWPDTEIFRHNGFRITETSYDGLWKMLKAKRIDAFNRGINEIYIEIDQQNSKDSKKNLMADEYLMVTYPFDYFFYLSPSKPHLHKTLEEGLKIALKNGDFIKNFKQHPKIQYALQHVKMSQRTIFTLSNPLLSSRIQSLPAEYWYQPND